MTESREFGDGSENGNRIVQGEAGQGHAPWGSAANLENRVEDADQILPFEITIAGAKEYGAAASARLFGVGILNEGFGI